MHGENDINHMNLVELQTLENNLEMWANNIRSQKMQIISREIDMLRNKEAILQAVNGVLQERAGRDLRYLSQSMGVCISIGTLLLMLLRSKGSLAGCWWVLVLFQWSRFGSALLRLVSPNGGHAVQQKLQPGRVH